MWEWGKWNLCCLFRRRCGGIDISPEGIDNATENAKKFKVSNKCKFIEMDGETISYKDNHFDYAIEYGALHHVDLEKALKEFI